MMMYMQRRWYIAAVALIVVYAASWILWFAFSTHADVKQSVEGLGVRDVAVVFGGLHQAGEPFSETNHERLDAAVVLYEGRVVDRVVVSNTRDAAEEMQAYLLDRGLGADDVLIDPGAVVTEDTCISLKRQFEGDQTFVYISHDYHIPRITFLCRRQELKGAGIGAEHIVTLDRAPVLPVRRAQIRFVRMQREAILTTLSLLGVYRPTL